MGYTLSASNRFKKDLAKAQKQGKDMERLQTVFDYLQNGEALPVLYRDHLLSGNWNGYRDCHIQPDWLLIYKVDEEKKEVRLARLGSHSELF